MRVVQIIDSLQPGGAERMAVNYANALAETIEFSGLVATRQEGGLKLAIADNVCYEYLARKSAFDLLALLRLRKYCRKHRVGIVHAHGTSFFIAVMLKLLLPKLKLVWHEHNGDRVNQKVTQNRLLSIESRWFDGVIVVNTALADWSRRELITGNIIYLPNFSVTDHHDQNETALHGIEGKRVLLLANLRHPKNHQFAVQAAAQLRGQFPEWTYHFVGRDFNDAYASDLKKLIAEKQLESVVFIYGLRLDIHNIISQSEICLLTSSYEGLPVALIEYGMLAKAVIVTAVGEMPYMVKNDSNGFVVAVDDVAALADRLQTLMRDQSLREEFATALHTQTGSIYSKDVVIRQYLDWLAQLR